MIIVLRRGPGALLWLVVAWLFPSLVFAEIVNRTIDDTFGDSQTGLHVTYLPGGAVWNGATCGDCAINPDVANTFNRTYTAATYYPNLGSVNITMQFNGTAIYVFFILANNQTDKITTLTLVNFILDGGPPQLFMHAPESTTSNLEYNQLVFAETNLINAEHTLVISTSDVNINVYVNFDYAIYTHDDDASSLPLSGLLLSTAAGTTTTVLPKATPTVSPSSSALGHFSNVKNKAAGPIAGGVVGVFLILALTLFSI